MNEAADGRASEDQVVPITYEILIRGRASQRLLRPLLDGFTLDHDRNGDTRLVGDIVDPAQLHGVLAHLTGLNAEIISIAHAIPTPSSPSHVEGSI